MRIATTVLVMRIVTVLVMIIAVTSIVITFALVGAVVGALIAPILAMDVTPTALTGSAGRIIHWLCVPAECGSNGGKGLGL